MSSVSSWGLQHPHSEEFLKQLSPSSAAMKNVWSYFLMLLETPRPSHDLAKVSKKVIDFAKDHNLQWQQDETGNIIIRRPAAKGFENAPKVAVQSHLDVVCSKTTDKVHDFHNDFVLPLFHTDDAGEKWIKADRTTLGADDGIGVAACLAALVDPEIQCGPLEALFTVDEETTMGGAEFIGKAPFLQSDIMLNLDSEEEKNICVGCAGGGEFKFYLPVQRSQVDATFTGLKVQIHSLLGGHSGTDIHRNHANALIVMARILSQVHANTTHGLLLGSINGGNAPNAIPRDAMASIYVHKDEKQKAEEILKKEFAAIQNEYKTVEVNKDGSSCMVFEISPMPGNAVVGNVCNNDTTRRVLDVMLSLPHGVIEVNPDLQNQIETSISFSIINLSYKLPESADVKDEVLFHCFARSSSTQALHVLGDKLKSLARLSGCRLSDMEGFFPGWKPNVNSPALKQVIKAAEIQFGKDNLGTVYSVHAGLECGLFMNAYPNLDCVSIGPTVEGAHSPQERLLIRTVEPFYQWLVLSLNFIAKGGQ